MASTQLGIEIGKGMQEQGKARQLSGDREPGSHRSHGKVPVMRTFTAPTEEQPPAPSASITAIRDHDGDNPSPENGSHPVQ